MRLTRDAELPAGLKSLSRLQFIHGFVVVVMATVIWLPAPATAAPWLPLVPALVALHLMLQTGLYAGAELNRGGHSLVPAAALMLVVACVTPFLPALAGSVVLGVALLMQFLIEKGKAVRDAWPPAWCQGRKQHMQFQVVALASVVAWRLSQGNPAWLSAVGV